MQKNHLGFTLVEMLVVMVILGVISMIAVPNFMNQLKHMESKNTANHIKTFLVNAKQDAIIYQNILTICLADHLQNCVRSQGQNLISFTDKNHNRNFDKGIDILRSSVFLKQHFGDVHLGGALRRRYVDFKPHNGSPIGHMGHIRYCPKDNNTNNTFKVSFSKTGMIKLKFHKDEKVDC